MEIVQPAYDSSAYKMKYRVTFKSQAGYDVRMEVYVKSSAMMIVKEIGAFRSLSLALEGNGAIDDPITKSTLQFSMVDDIYKAGSRTVKYGNWQEFFTPDSTAYLIVLKTDEGQGYVTRWSGYVTPDSWEEDLGAYGDIRVKARDNIGHLADFEFDMEGGDDGIVTVNMLLKEAMKRISMPMSLKLNTAGVNEAYGVYGDELNILSAGINVAAFEGRSWYDVVSSVLSSLGLTMRYTDNNAVTVMPLANLPLLGETQTQRPLSVQFLDGTRTLMPAYREIVSETDYGMQDEIDLDIKSGLDFVGTESTYSYEYTSQPLPSGGTTTGSGTAPYHPIVGADTGWSDLSAMFNPEGYEIGPFLLRDEGVSAKDYVFLCACQTDGKTQQYSFMSNSLGIDFKVQFAPTPVCLRYGKLYSTYGYISEIQYAVMIERGGVVRYWNGYDWVNTLQVLTESYEEGTTSFEVSLAPCDDINTTAKVTVLFDKIVVRPGGTETKTGIYVRMQSMTVAATMQMLEDDKVHTVNNEIYNVKANRQLEIGALSRSVPFVTPQSYLNAMWDMTAQDDISPFAYYCVIANGFYSDNEQIPLPGIIHKQMLMFHHIAQAVLSGECASADSRLLGFGSQYRYKGKNYILQGGTLNLRTGRMEGITLREYASYAELWQAHVDIKYFEVGYDGGRVTVRIIAGDNLSWVVTTPDWIRADVTSGTGTKDILLDVTAEAKDRIGRVMIGPAIVTIRQRSVGDFNSDYSNDFKQYSDFSADYEKKDIN